VDSSLRTPLNCKLLSHPECIRPIVATTLIDGNSDENNEKRNRANALEGAGATIEYCKATHNGWVDLEDLLGQNICKYLTKSEKLAPKYTSVMVEGGSSIITSFLNRPDLIDNIIVTICPVMVSFTAIFKLKP
jgi:riboflavin biosynthesis pyrimidine reductase